MENRPGVVAFDSRAAMAARVADLVESFAQSADHSGKIELAVSGGSTPNALYEALAQRSLDWRDVRLTLVDERWVSKSHPRSNAAFIERAFRQAEGVELLEHFTGSETPHSAVDALAERMGERENPFDAVILGMGEDGHTASWFPNADGLDCALESDSRVCAITALQSDVTGEEVERMTLTLSAMKDARLIVLLLAGEKKKLAFEAALEPGAVENMPVRAMLRARPDMWVCWAP